MRYLKNVKLLSAIAVVLSGVILTLVWFNHVPAREITRPELEQLMQTKALTGVRVSPTPYGGFYHIEANHVTGNHTERVFVTTHLEEAQVKALFDKAEVKADLPGQSLRGQWINLLSTGVIAALVIGLMAYQYNVGRGKNSRVRQRPKVSFQDVAGIEEAKGEVQEIVDFLRDPRKYQRVGGNLPKGVLLIGPPGTGKTMLAKAIACEAKANFFSAHGSDFTEVFVGVGAKRVRQLFRLARQNEPADRKSTRLNSSHH